MQGGWMGQLGLERRPVGQLAAVHWVLFASQPIRPYQTLNGWGHQPLPQCGVPSPARCPLPAAWLVLLSQLEPA